MKLYQTIDGTLIGFYGERGGQVTALLYQDVYESVLVTKTREEEITIPGFYKIVITTIPGYWDEKEVYVQGHSEQREVWVPEYSVTRYREVPGHYERKSIWVPEYYVTRYYWREAHPARGLEAAWIPYQHLIPAGYKLQRVWIDTYTEEYQEIIPAGYKLTRVWIEGEYVTEKIWIPEHEKSDRVWVPPETDIIIVEYQELEDVWVGKEPIYQYVDQSKVRLFEVLELYPGAGPGPDYEDVITIMNKLTGEELKTTARYLGLAERVADNEYVMP